MYKSQKEFTDSDMIAMGIGILLASTGVFISFYPELNDLVLLGLGIFALIFGVASTIKNTSLRNTLILFSFIAPFIIGLSIKDLALDLNNINNGLSLIALSYTIFIIPFSRTRQEREQQEVKNLQNKINDLSEEIDTKNDIINNHDRDTFNRLKEFELSRIKEKAAIKKEYEDRINETHQFKNTEIQNLKKSMELIKKNFEVEKNKLNKQARNDVLTLNQQHHSEVSLLENRLVLLKDKLNLLDKKNKELKIENSRLSKRNKNFIRPSLDENPIQIGFDDNSDYEVYFTPEEYNSYKESKLEVINDPIRIREIKPSKTYTEQYIKSTERNK